ncbi:cyclase family protein [Arthrobacter mobilis]|uniref:Cyclase family protein n=1 Tax=Arthrobacter mobilis TaxID=2724944 RepID=A0A7X6HEM4_9MICC|nr:cyclase family protein [Arthrobacter mobilis]NKX55744.1 cyclase family protein [Arthrobacter mobilis]
MRDLTQAVRTGMPVFPGDPEVSIEPALSIEHDVVAVSRLHLGSHSGTHVDAPSHTVAGGRSVDRLRLEELCGPALVLQVPGLADGEPIGWDRLAGGAGDGEVPARVVISTGWDRYWGSARYERHPVLSADAARQLWDRGMRLLAMDTLNPDPTHQEGGFRLPVHDLVLGGDGIIVENLRAATGLPQQTVLGIFPLNLEGCDGAPARAVAWAAS